METRNLYATVGRKEVLLSKESLFPRIQDISADDALAFFKTSPENLILYEDIVDAKYNAIAICTSSRGVILGHEMHPNQYRYYVVPIYEVEVSPESLRQARHMKIDITSSLSFNRQAKLLYPIYEIVAPKKDVHIQINCYEGMNVLNISKINGVMLFHKDLKDRYIPLTLEYLGAQHHPSPRCIIL